MNESIRKEIKEARLKLWEVGNELGMAQSTFYRKLNSNLTSKEKERILKAVRDLKLRMLNEYSKEA